MTDIASVKQRFGIIGTSELLDRALDVALRVAPTDLTVLVTGESGVGKEFFPQVIHAYSARKHNKYIAVNCAAIPEGTIDSELFGHEKGSFTGALEARKGYFEEADGGTIFLDEVAELPHPTQARLLRVLQTGEFLRVGSSKVQKTNVRVVAATNVNLQEAIAAGRFREDLYYRLATVPILVPALRERPEDIPLLFRRFAAFARARRGGADVDRAAVGDRDRRIRDVCAHDVVDARGNDGARKGRVVGSACADLSAHGGVHLREGGERRDVDRDIQIPE